MSSTLDVFACDGWCISVLGPDFLWVPFWTAGKEHSSSVKSVSELESSGLASSVSAEEVQEDPLVTLWLLTLNCLRRCMITNRYWPCGEFVASILETNERATEWKQHERKIREVNRTLKWWLQLKRRQKVGQTIVGESALIAMAAGH